MFKHINDDGELIKTWTGLCTVYQWTSGEWIKSDPIGTGGVFIAYSLYLGAAVKIRKNGKINTLAIPFGERLVHTYSVYSIRVR